MREIRLGDVIDDFCVKCKRLTNHSVVSILNEQPAKVRCRTCYSDHDYRHEIAPPSKKELKKMELFNEVLGGIVPGASRDGRDGIEETADGSIEELDADAASESEPELAPEPEPVPAKRAKKGRAKKA